MQRALHRVLSPFQVFGSAAGALYLLDRLLRSLSPALGLRVYGLHCQPVAQDARLPPRLRQHLHHRLLLPGDPDLAQLNASPSQQAARFAQGADCLAVYRRGILLGSIWLQRGTHHEDEVRCRYELARPEVSAFDFDLVVLPAHRMGIGFAALWDAADEHLRTQGVRFCFSRISRFNLASRTAHARLGSRAIGWAVVLQAGPMELMAARTPPFAAWSWKGMPGPRLILQPVAAAGPPPRPSPPPQERT